MDMVNLNHAKKAQALASDLDYRKKLHDYTILPDDIKVQQAKKAYNLQSDVRKSGSKYWITRNIFLFIFHLLNLLYGLPLTEPVPL